LAQDRSAANVRILPALGEVDLTKLTTKRVRDWHTGLAAAPRIEARLPGDPALQAKVKLWQENFVALDVAAGQRAGERRVKIVPRGAQNSTNLSSPAAGILATERCSAGA
jgi:hypothetical protein